MEEVRYDKQKFERAMKEHKEDIVKSLAKIDRTVAEYCLLRLKLFESSKVCDELPIRNILHCVIDGVQEIRDSMMKTDYLPYIFELVMGIETKG